MDMLGKHSEGPNIHSKCWNFGTRSNFLKCPWMLPTKNGKNPHVANRFWHDSDVISYGQSQITLTSPETIACTNNRKECQGAKNSRREPVLVSLIPKRLSQKPQFQPFMLIRSSRIKMNVKQRGNRSLQEIWMDGPIEPSGTQLTKQTPEDPEIFPKLPFAS